jgi:uncharacterized glyoxalase superfamily protein PhnB
MATRPIPDGFHTITPYLVLDDLPGFLDFVARAFDAEELERVTLPDGSVMHAQVRIGDSPLMTGGAQEDWPAMPALLHLYVEDADAVYGKALAAGAEPVREMQDEFYGDRSGGVKDGWGNIWWIATRKEELGPDEVARRAAQERGL